MSHSSQSAAPFLKKTFNIVESFSELANQPKNPAITYVVSFARGPLADFETAFFRFNAASTLASDDGYCVLPSGQSEGTPGRFIRNVAQTLLAIGILGQSNVQRTYGVTVPRSDLSETDLFDSTAYSESGGNVTFTGVARGGGRAWNTNTQADMAFDSGLDWLSGGVNSVAVGIAVAAWDIFKLKIGVVQIGYGGQPRERFTYGFDLTMGAGVHTGDYAAEFDTEVTAALAYWGASELAFIIDGQLEANTPSNMQQQYNNSDAIVRYDELYDLYVQWYEGWKGRPYVTENTRFIMWASNTETDDYSVAGNYGYIKHANYSLEDFARERNDVAIANSNIGHWYEASHVADRWGFGYKGIWPVMAEMLGISTESATYPNPRELATITPNGRPGSRGWLLHGDLESTTIDLGAQHLNKAQISSTSCRIRPLAGRGFLPNGFDGGGEFSVFVYGNSGTTPGYGSGDTVDANGATVIEAYDHTGTARRIRDAAGNVYDDGYVVLPRVNNVLYKFTVGRQLLFCDQPLVTGDDALPTYRSLSDSDGVTWYFYPTPGPNTLAGMLSCRYQIADGATDTLSFPNMLGADLVAPNTLYQYHQTVNGNPAGITLSNFTGNGFDVTNSTGSLQNVHFGFYSRWDG